MQVAPEEFQPLTQKEIQSLVGWRLSPSNYLQLVNYTLIRLVTFGEQFVPVFLMFFNHPVSFLALNSHNNAFLVYKMV